MAKDKLLTAIGNAVRKRRLAFELSQDKFADRISMHRAYYSAIERGEKNLSLRLLSRVAAGLKVSLSSLLSDAGH
jgi:transcriptional regulator with XRE-family HTH domain